jgi:hypothetical protein
MAATVIHEQTFPASSDPVSGGHLLEKRLRRLSGAFAGAYMAAGDAHAFIAAHPCAVSETLVHTLADMLADSRHRTQSQCLQLYRRIADALVSAMSLAPDPNVGRHCFHRLHRLARSGRGALLRALAEAASALPLDFPHIAREHPGRISPPRIALRDMCARFGIDRPEGFRQMGRSLVAAHGDRSRTVVIKVGGSGEDARRLLSEYHWMHWLAAWNSPSGQSFGVPEPVACNGHPLVRLTGAPRCGAALVYIAPPGYFHYPNTHHAGKRPPPERLFDIMERNAVLLGELMASGLCHDAPIPLFHNRIQGHRRDDAGRYLWEHGGRLDQWLASCRYPNFGASGLRDFEHLRPLNGQTRSIHRSIGEHLLSLVLVVGAYFRAAVPGCRGMDGDGRPVDVRHQFDRELFQELIVRSWAGYFRGFAGSAPGSPVPHLPHIPSLVDDLVEAMGVDRHMEEVFRRDDQCGLDDGAFYRVLIDRGMTADAARGIRKGDADIRLMSGPHLGAFNGTISVPALIDFLAAAATLCILERHWRTRPPFAAATGTGEIP